MQRKDLLRPQRSRVTSVDLPTTLEIARQGVTDYLAVAQHLPPQVKTSFYNDQGIKHCFIATEPTVTFIVPGEIDKSTEGQLNTDDLKTISQTTKTVSRNFAVFTATDTLPTPMPDNANQISDTDYPRPKTLELYMFLNIPASSRIVRNYPEYFPNNAQEDPPNWLLTEVLEWRNDHRMYGLLSGFPIWDVEKYSQYSELMDRIVYTEDAHEDIEEFDKYAFGYVRRTKNRINKQKEVLEKLIPNITPEEIDLMCRQKTITGLGLNGFVGFDSVRDAAFIRRVASIYQRSGIASVNETSLANP